MDAVVANFAQTNPDLASILDIVTLVIAILMLIVSIKLLVIRIKYYARLSRAFGYSNGFAVGLIFLPFIFRLILAFGKSKHFTKNPNYHK